MVGFSWTRPRRIGAGAVLGGTLLCCSGCFSYVPAELPTLAPAHDVRVELTRVGFARLPEIPEHPGPDLSGQVVRVDADGLLLRVPVLIRTDGMVTGTVQQDLIIPAADIVNVEQRLFSRKRTVILSGGGVAALVALITAFGSGGPPVGQEPNKPPDDEAGSGAPAVFAHIPLFSILFR